MITTYVYLEQYLPKTNDLFHHECPKLITNIQEPSGKIIERRNTDSQENKDVIVTHNTQLKPFTKVTKMSPQNFTSSYPVPLSFPNPPIPVMMFPSSNIPGIPVTKTLSNSNPMEAIYYQNNPADIRFQRIGSGDFMPDVYRQGEIATKKVWKSNVSDVKYMKSPSLSVADSVSSTPKKKREYTNHESHLTDHKNEPPCTQNILDGLDELDLEIAEPCISIATNKAGDINTNKSKMPHESTLCNSKATTLVSESNDNSACKDNLIQRTALNVIGDDKDNHQKLSSNVNHLFSSPSPSIPGTWAFPSKSNYHNAPNSPFYGFNPLLNTNNMNMKTYNHVHIGNANKQLYPPHMSSPLVGNPIWNAYQPTDNTGKSNCYR